MHGFVELDVLSGAKRAMQELDGAKFMGRRIRVHWAYSNAEKSSPKDREAWTQLHVTFTSPRIDLLLCEDVLDRLFSRFGEVADVTVKKHSRVLEPQPFQSGYAFIYYYEAAPAIEAAERFKNTAVADVHFETSLSFRSQRIVENSLATAAAAQSLGLGDGVGSQLDALLFSDLTTPASAGNGTGLQNNRNPITDNAVSGKSTWQVRTNHFISSNCETYSVVSESAQTQIAELDREALLFDQSQQSSDSSLYLYAPFSASHSDIIHYGNGDNVNNNVDAGPKTISVDDVNQLTLQFTHSHLLENSALSNVTLQSKGPEDSPVTWSGLTGESGASSVM
jgi:RNA recognition motif-containing protein